MPDTAKIKFGDLTVRKIVAMQTKDNCIRCPLFVLCPNDEKAVFAMCGNITAADLDETITVPKSILENK